MSALQPKLRSDLTLSRRDDGERAYTLVKDPIRSVFYELSDLQITLAELFDGTRTHADITAELETTHGLTLDPVRVAKFATFLEQRFLLEITAYSEFPASMHKALSKALRHQCIRFRGVDQLGGRRQQRPDAALFAAAVRELADKKYLVAARTLAQILAGDPNHSRARQIYDLLQRTFFEQHQQLPSYMRMIHLWNPDRFLLWLDARVGRYLFGPLGVTAWLGLLVATLTILPDIRLPPLSAIDWQHVLLAPFCVGLVTLFIHELGHGLACKHYGGNVESMGIMVFYNVVPGAYCDVTETHTFRDRRHKVIVYLAGVLFEVPALCLWLWCYHLSADQFVLRNAILVWVAFDIYSIAQNISPFVKGYDGYYVVSNYLDMPELSERAFAYLSRFSAKHLLGVYPERERETHRERRVYLWFGLASATFYAGFYYGLWFRFLFPLLVRHLHTTGLVLAVLYACNVLGLPAVRGARSLTRFVVARRKEILTPRRCAAFAGISTLTSAILLTPYRSWADGEFSVQPHVLSVVRALEPGMIAHVAVREGQPVRRGDLLVRLDDTTLRYSERQLTEQITAEQSRLQALERGTRDEEIAYAAAAQDNAHSVAILANAALQRSQTLFASGLVSHISHELSESDARRTAAELSVTKRELAWVRAPAQREDIAQVKATLESLEARRADVRLRLSRMRLTSPSDGTIVNITGTPLPELIDRPVELGAAVMEVHNLTTRYGELWFSPTALLTPIAIDDELLLRANGDPHHEVRTRIRDVAPLSAHWDGASGVSAHSMEFGEVDWPARSTGHARVYFRPRTIAFNLFGGPLLQLIDFTLWSHI